MKLFKKYEFWLSDKIIRIYYTRTKDGIENVLDTIKKILDAKSLIITNIIQTTYIECSECGVYKPQGEMNLVPDGMGGILCYCIECDDTLDSIRKGKCGRE